MNIAPVRAAYHEWAAAYDSDRNLTRDLDGVVTSAILGERRYGAILELGCGTGKNTRLLARIGGRVHGLDFAEAMLAEARAKGFGAPVTFAVADLTHPWPCADARFDLVTGNLVLEHIDDLVPIFAEAARVLAPGGRLFLSEFHPFRQYRGGKARYERAQERIEVAAFVHNVSDFLHAAALSGFILTDLQEWWHIEDRDKPPRVLSLMFEK